MDTNTGPFSSSVSAVRDDLVIVLDRDECPRASADTDVPLRSARESICVARDGCWITVRDSQGTVGEWVVCPCETALPTVTSAVDNHGVVMDRICTSGAKSLASVVLLLKNGRFPFSCGSNSRGKQRFQSRSYSESDNYRRSITSPAGFYHHHRVMTGWSGHQVCLRGSA